MNRNLVFFVFFFFLGLFLFLNGFLLTRRVIVKHSNETFPQTKPKDFQRVFLILIDALRYDFIRPSFSSKSNNFQNQMSFVRHLIETRENQTFLVKMIADPPTTTLQRLKALTTGTLPTFIDLSYNFIGYEIEEDNVLYQLKNGQHRRNISLLGDDTWSALYPNVDFQDLHVYPSFDVHDLDTVDNGILDHLPEILENDHSGSSSFVIAHFLGSFVKTKHRKAIIFLTNLFHFVVKASIIVVTVTAQNIRK